MLSTIINYYATTYSLQECIAAVLVGVAAILLAHGTLQQIAGLRITWRLTDSAQGRMWLSFGTVMIASMPAQLDAYLPMVAALLVLACTVAFYVALNRILQPAPHRVRLLTARSGKRTTYIDNRKPVGYQWMNQRQELIGGTAW